MFAFVGKNEINRQIFKEKPVVNTKSINKGIEAKNQDLAPFCKQLAQKHINFAKLLIF